VSEEDEASLHHRVTEQRFWLIDPLDGTKEFIARNGEFTVNIALIDQGRSVLGVVYAPALDTLYWGGRGLGAFRLHLGATTPLRVAPRTTGTPCRVLASKSHLNADTQAFIDRLGHVGLVQAGSSLKFCRIAEGEADLYPRLSPTCEWDTAAAQAVLEGAGGTVVDLDGRALHYGKSAILNGSFVAVGDAEWMTR
jgi:3'(2'), 5'-bisphosphate nucleotidase